MRSLVVLSSCKAIIERLNPSAFESKVAYLLRGGLPAQSMSDGRGGGSALPLPDKVDKALRRARKRHHSLARQVLAGLQEMERVELSILREAPPVPDEPIVFCDFKGCTNMLEPGRKRGNCSTHRAAKYQEQPAESQA